MTGGGWVKECIRHPKNSECFLGLGMGREDVCVCWVFVCVQ